MKPDELLQLGLGRQFEGQEVSRDSKMKRTALPTHAEFLQRAQRREQSMKSGTTVLSSSPQVCRRSGRREQAQTQNEEKGTRLIAQVVP